MLAQRGAMCFVQTPYYHLCGHYGRPIFAPHGRCARAEHSQGACWEPQDIGVSSREAMCGNCERWLRAPETDQINTSNVGPVDCHKFNQLVKLHKQICDRRYCSLMLKSALPSADNDAVRAQQAALPPSLLPHTCQTQTSADPAQQARRLLLRPIQCRQEDVHQFSPPIARYQSPIFLAGPISKNGLSEFATTILNDKKPLLQLLNISSDKSPR